MRWRRGIAVAIILFVIPVNLASAARARARAGRHGARALVDVNVAGVAELAAVPGMGPKLAAALVESRDVDGPFEFPAQLTRVKGIGAVKAPRLARYLMFPRTGDGPGEGLDRWQPGTARPRHPVDLNTAHAGELAALPGMGWALAYRVVAERERDGAFRTLEDLYYVPGITRELIESWRSFLYVER